MRTRTVVLPNDSAVLEGLIREIEAQDRHPALGERKLLELVGPLQTEGASLRGLVAEDSSGMFAYLPLVKEDGGLFTVETVVRPDRRQEPVVDALLERATAAAVEAGASEIRLWAYVPEVMQAAERAGFPLERELFHMKAPLPLQHTPRFPPNIEFRGFQEGVDEAAWLDANNQIFLGHPENGNWVIADLDKRRRRPWFSSEGLRMAWDGEVLAGFCWTKTPSPQVGEIYVIGVLPDYQGVGLGRALLADGVNHMHTRQKVGACVLYVDASNRPAVRMYRSMGFGLHHTDRSYLFNPGIAALFHRAGTLA